MISSAPARHERPRVKLIGCAEISRADMGDITNVGPAHLETLHNLQGVARAKGELFAALPAGGTAVINGDDPRVLQLRSPTACAGLFTVAVPMPKYAPKTLPWMDTEPIFVCYWREKAGRSFLRLPVRYNVRTALLYG